MASERLLAISALVIFLSIGIGGACSGTDDGLAGTDGCSYLGCSDCSDREVYSSLLCNGAACTTAADCGALPQICTENLGTTITIFRFAHCLGGQCTYVRATAASCADSTPCAECANSQTPQQSCLQNGSFSECISCCGWPSSDEIGPCACNGGPCSDVCAGSSICVENGTGPSSACMQCVRTTLEPGGACATNTEFQQRCISNPNSGSCARRAQCLVSCPAP